MFALALAVVLQATAAPTGPSRAAAPNQPVGFLQRWVIDSTRRLPNGETYELRYRPVLLNLWYPTVAAGGARMPVRGYLDGLRSASGASAMPRYVDALLAYQWSVAWKEVAGTAPDSTLPERRRVVDAHFASLSGAVRDAPMQPGDLPVVVYTQGAGSSLDDNVVLCELLASRGYAVIGSAYPAEANDRFSTDASDESRRRDIRRLLQEVERLTGRSTGRAVVIGHSAGAQAMLLMATDPSAPIDGVLAFDTTQDYAGLTDHSWSYFTDRAVAERRQVTRPLVFVAGPEALFELADSLSESPRTLVTMRGMRHNDYISQGIVQRRLRAGFSDDDSTARHAAERGYHALNAFTLRWLDEFHGRGSGAEASIDRSAEAVTAVLTVPVGSSRPDAIPAVPTSARQLRHLFWSASVTEFADRALKARQADPQVASDAVVMMLIVDAIRRGDAVRARGVLAALNARAPNAIRV